MDALGALSVAGTIITFVDFGGKLLSNTRKIYKSKDGALSSIVDTEVVTSDLLILLQGLRRKLPENRPPPKQQYSLCGGDDDDEALDKICVRCVALAEELTVRLNKLKLSTVPRDGQKTAASSGTASNITTGSSTQWPRRMLRGEGSKAVDLAKALAFRKWESFRKALEAVWSKREIEEMAATLRDLRDEMEFHILVSFRRLLYAVAAQQSDASRQIEQSTRRIIDTFLNSRDSFASQLKAQTEKLVQIQDVLTSKHAETPHVTDGQLGASSSFESMLSDAARSQSALEDRSERKMAVEENLCGLMAENEILGSLSFPSMMIRKESIEPAHTQTFRWIHEDPGPTKEHWHNLVAWLRYGHGIYWVNGKLGSGKSTFIKYVYDHRKTREALESWSKDLPIEIFDFFFWYRGDEDQRSQNGLLRSLLFQLFQRHRDKIEHILPDLWNAYYTRAKVLISRRDISPDLLLLPPKPPNLTTPQLKHAFLELIACLRKLVKICFFIDGLDQCDGDYLEIIELSQELCALPDVKVCISSRPLLVFEQAFRDLPGLRLQDLTKRDIKEYVNSHPYSHRNMKQLAKRHPDETSQLVSDVVHKARGVFLWVKFVTRSLLGGLSDYNRLSDLKKRVSYLPIDLEELYRHILDGVDPFYRQQMSQIFQTFRTGHNGSPGRVTLLDLSWADDEDDLLVEAAPIQPYTNKEIEERCEIMGARLKSICGGLLETTSNRFTSLRPDSCVVYLHHTVSDWLAEPDVWEDIVSITAGTGFSPNLALLKSQIMRLKTWNPTYDGRFDLGMVIGALNYAREAERDL
ncbi:hypothetical protein PG993_006215 [Apiospora rasikravindrae]|uniref:NACHT domain-containing protein n=1 Tax=Apiospora rasikravindrae TaxID=990691 RepID=A0ABR1T5J8_9PEZI